MPEADYTFKPGSTPEARTYAQVIAHIAQSAVRPVLGAERRAEPDGRASSSSRS